MKSAIIIADDLTGACDTGIKLAAMGWDTEVVLDASLFPDTAVREGAFYTINTNTRSASRETAYSVVKKVAAAVKRAKPQILYKKIDSVLRGNVGAEIDAVLDVTGLKLAVVAPSLPQSSRVVCDGVLRVDCPPSKPVCRDVKKLLFNGMDEEICRGVSLREVRSGSAAVEKIFLDSVAGGLRYCVVDAQTDADLAVVAEAIWRCGAQLLPVGSAGLAEQLFRREPAAASGQGSLRCGADPRALGLIVVTSKHPSAVAQLRRLRRRGDAAFFTFHTSVLEHTEPAAVARRLARRIVQHHRAHDETRIYVITTAANVDQDEPDSYVPDADLSDDGIATAATTAAAMVARALPFTAVTASGGDTASRFLSNLPLQRVTLLEEPLPGTVAARMDIREEVPKLLLTKSGGFGDEEVLDKLADYMLTHRVAAQNQLC